MPKSNTAMDAPSPLVGRDGIPLRPIAAPLIRRLQQISASLVSEALTGSDLVQLEFAMLVFIDDMPGIDQRTLAEAMGIDRNSVGVIIERLEARGLVERTVRPSDRRALQLRLTPKGRTLWRDLVPRARKANAHLLSPLKPAERDLFVSMLVRLVQAHRVYAVPGGGRRKRTTQSSVAISA
jgi:DNA-binding MarR family transcriptional regulator